MSVFGNNSMIPSGTLNNNRPQDNDKRKGKKPFRTKNKPRNNNGNNDSSTGNSKGNSNGPRKPFKQSNTKAKKDPVDTEAMVDSLPPSRIIPKSSVEYQSFGNDDIQQTGPVVSNISALGYKPKKTQPREVPKYLLNQPRLLVPLPFEQHEWDKANQQKMLDMETQNNGSDFLGLYEEFQQMRETERKKMEELGLVDAENIRKDLTDAISFRGTCLDMCPTFERVRRALENNVKAFEKDPTTNKICRERAVKAFSRPAAGQPPPLPSEVRPPFILTKSLDYLVENILPKLPDSHSFIWDRTRSIRQDFTYQNYYGPEAIDCNERIVRIHLISLHVMAGSKVEYSQQQELEQFNKALQTLVEIYQDVRNHGGHCPNEAEFRAYYLISHLRESEIEYEIQQLPKDILDNYLVKLALQIRKIVSQNNVVERGFKNTNGSLNLFVEFFSLVYDKSTPFLMACLLETQFNEIRFYAIKAMTRSYHTKGKAYDASILQKMLGFDKLEELTRFLNYYEIDTFNEDGQVLVDLVNKEKLESKQYKINSINDKPKLSQAYSTQINKKINVELKVFVNSGKLNSNLQLKSVEQIKAVPTVSNNNNNNKLDDLRSRLMKTRESKKHTPDVVDSKPVSNGLKPTTSVKPEPSVPTLAFQQPQFSFTKQKEEHKEEPAAVPVEIPTIDFKSQMKPAAEPKKETAFNLQPVKKDPPAFTFKSTDQPSKTVGGIKSNSTVVAPKLPEIIKPLQAVVPTPSLTVPVVPQTKKLSESPHFKQASEAVVSQIISQTIDEELNKYLPKVINHNNKVREKERIVDLFGNQLYDAFMNEILFKLCMDQQAAKVNTKNMLAKYFTIFRKKSEKLRSVNELKKRRLNELNEISFNTLKRQSSNSSFSQTKRRRWNESIDSIVEKRDEITRLWAPVGFNYFLNRVSNTVSASSFKEVKFLLLVENWRLNYSKWLSSKLGLQLNKEEKVYERTLEDTIKVKLTTLPKNQLNEGFLKNALFVLFECGLADDNDKRSIGDKLKRDGKILNKVSKVVKKASKFDVRVLVVYWDVSNSKLTPGDIKLYLNADDIILCDMTGDDINEILTSGINELSRTIKPLSKEPKEFNKPKLKASESTIDDNKFKDMELRLIKKAKLDKKYSYLNNHSMINQLFNTSKLNLSRLNNSTLNPNISNIMHSNILDNSFLNQSIIEESTPFASPKRSSTPTVVKNKLHKKGSLQQLIDLTTKVKSKYRQ